MHLLLIVVETATDIMISILFTSDHVSSYGAILVLRTCYLK